MRDAVVFIAAHDVFVVEIILSDEAQDVFHEADVVSHDFDQSIQWNEHYLGFTEGTDLVRILIDVGIVEVERQGILGVVVPGDDLLAVGQDLAEL